MTNHPAPRTLPGAVPAAAAAIRTGAATDQGPRPAQCDAAATAHLSGPGTWAAAVVDGYGTHPDVPAAALRAARTAVRAALSSGSAPAALECAGREFAEVDAEGWPEPDAVGALAVAEGQGAVSVAWTGDVRVYALEADGLRQLTDDHTEGARLRAAAAVGEAVVEDPAEHDHVVTSTLGRLPVDPAIMGTATYHGPWQALVLTTDGVHDALDHDDLHRIVATTPDPQECADALVAVARAVDAERDPDQAVADNATAVVLRADEDPEEAARESARAFRVRDMDTLRHRDQDEYKARTRLAERGYGTGQRDGDADTVAAVEAVLREDPDTVTHLDRSDLARLKAALTRRAHRQ